MRICDSRLWICDLDEVTGCLPELRELENSTILVTGCTGLICSAVVDLLARWNETHDGKIRILAAARSAQKTAKRFARCYQADWFAFLPYDAASPETRLEAACDYIIHGAGNASPGRIISEPVETMMSNFMGLKTLLDLARRQAAKRLLYISSSEVYGKKERNRPSRTDDYGWIDLLNPRSSYSIGKCAAETLCASCHEEYGVDSVIVRPGHIYGPTASESDNRVSSAWAYAAARGENLIMKSDGAQLRSYCYCLDCASAILKVLLKGESVHAYNISNPDSVITIRELAEILTKTAGTELRTALPSEAERKGFNPMSDSSLDSSELLALGWKGLFDAERGLTHTVRILRETML